MALELVLLALIATATALATGLGALPVGSPRLRAVPESALWGATGGIMAATAVAGLLRPALQDGSVVAVLAGVATGVGAMLLIDWRVSHSTAGGRRSAADRTSAVVFIVLLAHSLPEGLAIGTAAASGDSGLGLFVILAIALQNVPEGTATALPMAAAGDGRRRRFEAAVASSLPQVPGALIAYVLVDVIEGLLPFCFAMAGGAMLGVVAKQILPQAAALPRRRAALASALGSAALVTAMAVAFDA